MASDQVIVSRRGFPATATAAGLGGFASTQSTPARAAVVYTDFSTLPPYGNGTLSAGIRSRQIANVHGMTVGAARERSGAWRSSFNSGK